VDQLQSVPKPSRVLKAKAPSSAWFRWLRRPEEHAAHGQGRVEAIGKR